MILRPLPLTLLFLLPSLIAAEDDPFDCSKGLSIESVKYDLFELAGEHTVSRNRDTPPTTVIDELRFNVCKDLEVLGAVPAHDQCPEGTRACLTQTNKKDSESDRIVSVIPVAQSSILKPESAALSSSEGFKLTFHGPSYPASTESETQSFELNIVCASDPVEPIVTSYDGRIVSVEWKTPVGCKSNGGGNGDAEKPPSDDVSQGSGIGWFFLVLFLAFMAYFGLGAYYNYSTYGATGVDLIPHRDFWQEVPHMARDVLSHLCSSVRSQQKPSRGGYIAV